MIVTSEKEPDKAPMPKLYGIAVAGIPTDDGVTIFCTPIAVPKGKRQNFEILEELKFDIKWDDGEGQRTCFIKLVETLDKIVKLQQESCTRMGVGYRPVCLYVGDDSRKPVTDINRLYWAAFTPPHFSSAKVPGGSGALSQSELWIERLSSQKWRDLNFGPFKQACEKLPELLNRCIWERGSFAAPDTVEHVDHMQPSPLDRELAALKEKIDRGEDANHRAHRALVREAYNQGYQHGLTTMLQPAAFAIPLPRGYRTRRPDGSFEINESAKARLPRYCFYDWHPDYRAGFYTGFDEAYGAQATKGVYRHFKLPLDPSNPPFTDPCADKVVEQFQIIEGVRKPKNVKTFRDFPKLYEEVTALCQEVVTAFAEPPRHSTTTKHAIL